MDEHHPDCIRQRCPCPEIHGNRQWQSPIQFKPIKGRTRAIRMGTGYQVITDRILKLLEAGTVPWHRPCGGDERRSKNLVSDKRYRGVNVFLLSAAGYEAPYWLTFKQAGRRDRYVRMEAEPS
ncbi:MAG: DUF1738 domain-containing protein [Chloroflexi bacterium]|nr:DUF1738 domain-containing protein [Chloroflexota bacterium]